MDNGKEILHWLEKNFDRINEWLNYAEAKNGILVASNFVIAFGFIQIFGNFAGNCYILAYLANVTIFLIIGALIALVSFFPVLEISNKHKEKKNENPYFFHDLAGLELNEFTKLLSERFPGENSGKGKLVEDLSTQILANSRICMWKLRCFKIALFFTVTGIITPFLSIPLAIIFKFWRNYFGVGKSIT